MKGFTLTDIGKVRSENQDCIRLILNTSPTFGVIVLCDGMGGARAGSIASDLAVRTFHTFLNENLSDKKNKEPLADLMLQAACLANLAVFTRANEDADCAGMGTTLVAIAVKGRNSCVINVGDSRAYLISDGAITQITSDHSYVEDMVRKGLITREQAAIHPRRNIITRVLGVDEAVECDIFTPTVKKGDILLLCSDGLSNTLSDKEILEISKKSKSLREISKMLVDLSLTRGAPDNVTVGLLQR